MPDKAGLMIPRKSCKCRLHDFPIRKTRGEPENHPCFELFVEARVVSYSESLAAQDFHDLTDRKPDPYSIADHTRFCFSRKTSSIVQAQAGANASVCFSKALGCFLADLGYNISEKEVVA